MDNKVKNIKFDTLKTKINNLEEKIPYATVLIHINQYNTDKYNLDKKVRMLIKKKKKQTRVVNWLQLFWIQKLVKLKIKIMLTLNVLLLKNLKS